MVTVSALALSVIEGIALGLFPHSILPLLLLPLVLFVRMALNAIDGMIAREHKMQTIAGKYLNEVGDVVSDLVLYMPFLVILTTPVAVWLFAVFLIGTVASEVVGIMGEHIGGVRRYDGPMGKSDRAAGISALAVGLLIGASLHPLIDQIFIGILALGAWHTVYRRYHNAPQGDES